MGRRYWRESSRNAIKAALAPVGSSLFTPHLLGAYISDKRVLVPGDAEILNIIVQGPELNDGELIIELRIRWTDWSFPVSKSWPFVSAKRQPQQTDWQLRLDWQPVPASEA